MYPDNDLRMQHTGEPSTAPRPPSSPRRRGKSGKLFAGALVVVAVAFGAAYGTGMLDEFLTPDAPLDVIPVIRADNESYKTRPDSPGGMDIPHQDKLVYDSLEEASPPLNAERLLPEAELPMTLNNDVAKSEDYREVVVPADVEGAQPESLAAAPTVAVDAAKATDKSADEAAAADAEKSAAAVVAESKAASTNTPAPAAAVVDAQPQPTATPEVKPAVVEEPAAAAPSFKPDVGGTHWVQVASGRNVEQVRVTGQKMKQKHANLLQAMSVNIQTATVAGQSEPYHRLQFGGFAARAQAVKLCEALKAQKQDCLVVRNP